jgi:hypothetical protein
MSSGGLQGKSRQVFKNQVSGAKKDGVGDGPVTGYVELEKRRIDFQARSDRSESAKPVDYLGEHEPAEY